MNNYTISATDYERLQAVLQAARDAYNSALLLRSQGIVISRTDVAMAVLKDALDKAAGVTVKEVKADADRNRTGTAKTRRTRNTP